METKRHPLFYHDEPHHSKTDLRLTKQTSSGFEMYLLLKSNDLSRNTEGFGRKCILVCLPAATDDSLSDE